MRVNAASAVLNARANLSPLEYVMRHDCRTHERKYVLRKSRTAGYYLTIFHGHDRYGEIWEHYTHVGFGVDGIALLADFTDNPFC